MCEEMKRELNNEEKCFCYHGYRKAKNQRVKRALVNKEPKIYENDKRAMFIRGGRTTETITQALKDLVSNGDKLLSWDCS